VDDGQAVSWKLDARDSGFKGKLGEGQLVTVLKFRAVQAVFPLRLVDLDLTVGAKHAAGRYKPEGKDFANHTMVIRGM
jgi:hypothetical protein